MLTVRQRLQHLKKQFGLSTSDLSVLLGCNRSTVLSWERGAIPSPSRDMLVRKKLSMIQRACDHGAFPVPLEVTQFKRKTYLLEALNVHNARISQPRSTTGRPRA